MIVDRFGNIQLNLTPEDLSRVGIEPGTQVEIEVGLQRFYACAASTFADVRVGDIVLYEDAYGNIALAINVGQRGRDARRAARRLRRDHGPAGLNSPQRAAFSETARRAAGPRDRGRRV